MIYTVESKRAQLTLRLDESEARLLGVVDGREARRYLVEVVSDWTGRAPSPTIAVTALTAREALREALVELGGSVAEMGSMTTGEVAVLVDNRRAR